MSAAFMYQVFKLLTCAMARVNADKVTPMKHCQFFSVIGFIVTCYKFTVFKEAFSY